MGIVMRMLCIISKEILCKLWRRRKYVLAIVLLKLVEINKNSIILTKNSRKLMININLKAKKINNNNCSSIKDVNLNL
jgi:hypothetical protein